MFRKLPSPRVDVCNSNLQNQCTARPMTAVQRLPPLILTSTLLSGAVDAQTLGDIHLNVVPRTAAEAVRVKTVLHPQTNFRAPQEFEAMSAGAATVRVTPDSNAFSHHQEISASKTNCRSKLATVCSASSGYRHRRRHWRRTGLVRCTMPAPANAATSRMAMGIHPKGQKTMRFQCSCGCLFPEGPTTALPQSRAILPPFLSRPTVPSCKTSVWQGTGRNTGYRSHTKMSKPHCRMDSASLCDNPRSPPLTLNMALHLDAMLSPRVAPQMIGLGLLEAIPAADILALADPDDADGDGTSGRPNIVWSVEYDQPMLGRFGLRAGTPTIRHQSAGAFAGDIGISNPLFPAAWGECTENQPDCRAAPHGDDDGRGFEIGTEGLDLVTFYSRNLGVPAGRDAGNPEV